MPASGPGAAPARPASAACALAAPTHAGAAPRGPRSAGPSSPAPTGAREEGHCSVPARDAGCRWSGPAAPPGPPGSPSSHPSSAGQTSRLLLWGLPRLLPWGLPPRAGSCALAIWSRPPTNISPPFAARAAWARCPRTHCLAAQAQESVRTVMPAHSSRQAAGTNARAQQNMSSSHSSDLVGGASGGRLTSVTSKYLTAAPVTTRGAVTAAEPSLPAASRLLLVALTRPAPNSSERTSFSTSLASVSDDTGR
mmetsp:Transcript_100766/g.285646  ORF Transcript_100766/g.285646 Transcript_100766/m.285646 type:complete len:252 (-) Transcript_100766:1582-2337(-)